VGARARPGARPPAADAAPRAVEVALLTGERISVLHARRARPPRFAVRYLVVDPGPALADRIAARVDAMLAAGWLDEVRRLAAAVPA
jgi:tRNA dimethylallyltransferase